MTKIIDQAYSSLTTIAQRHRVNSVVVPTLTNTETSPDIPDPLDSTVNISSDNSQNTAVSEPPKSDHNVVSSSPRSVGHFNNALDGKRLNEMETEGTEDAVIVTPVGTNTGIPDDDIPVPKKNPRKRKSKFKASQDVSHIQNKIGPPLKRRRLFKKKVISPNESAAHERVISRLPEIDEVSNAPCL
jgi:hypothetical protein